MDNLSIAKDYEFETIEEFYQYIADSFTNGNFQQVADLMYQLSDLPDFIDWLKDSNNSGLSFSNRISLIDCWIRLKDN